MAVPPAAAQVISPFPTPPIYSKLYTSEAVAGGSAPLPPCIHADFTAFGEEYHLNDEVIRPLTDAGIRQLYVNKKEWKMEMKKLNSSAVAAFVDLVSILITCPDSQDRTDKLNDIRDIFINMHHLINEFRPIQARDTLKIMQQKQLSELEEAVADFKLFLVEAKNAFRHSLKMDDVQRMPIPPIRPELEGLDEEEGEQSVEAALGSLSVGGGGGGVERKTVAPVHRYPADQLAAIRLRARRDERMWKRMMGEEEGEKMEE